MLSLFDNCFNLVKVQIICELAWSVLLLTTIFVIPVVKLLWTHQAQSQYQC